MILVPNELGKWETVPYGLAKQRRILDEDVLAEVENAIVYFIVGSAVHLKSELPMVYNALKQVWKAETTLLSITEYGNSLPTSIPTEPIGEKVPEIIQKVAGMRASSVPS
jgi:hypothetical protein